MKYERPLLHLGQGVKISGGENILEKLLRNTKFLLL